MSQEIHKIGPYLLGKSLGVGSSGKVKLGFNTGTGQQVAVKIVEKNPKDKKQTIEKKLEREIAIMKLLSHPHILRLYDVYETPQHLFLILEYVAGGELFDYLVQQGALSDYEALRFFQQIIEGVDYCHSLKICHRDLKPENILMDSEHNIKIADFGMASVARNGGLLETSCGSPHYASPEVIMGIKYDGSVADVWSCGVILYALAAGKLPFDDANIRTLLSKVKSGVYAMPQFLNKDLQDLITRMLVVDPKQRITLSEVRKHPWYTSRQFVLLPELQPIDQMSFKLFASAEEIDMDIVNNLRALGFGTPEDIVPRLLALEPSYVLALYRVIENRESTPQSSSKKPLRVRSEDNLKGPKNVKRVNSEKQTKSTLRFALLSSLSRSRDEDDQVSAAPKENSDGNSEGFEARSPLRPVQKRSFLARIFHINHDDATRYKRFMFHSEKLVDEVIQELATQLKAIGAKVTPKNYRITIRFACDSDSKKVKIRIEIQETSLCSFLVDCYRISGDIEVWVSLLGYLQNFIGEMDDPIPDYVPSTEAPAPAKEPVKARRFSFLK